jgi:hypothetical protein
MKETIVKSIIAFFVLVSIQVIFFIVLTSLDGPERMLNTIRKYVKYIRIEYICFLCISCIGYRVHEYEDRYISLCMIYYSVLGLLGTLVIVY